MAIVCASRDSNTSSRLLLLGEINRIHRELLRDCFSEYNTPRGRRSRDKGKFRDRRRSNYQVGQKSGLPIYYFVS